MISQAALGDFLFSAYEDTGYLKLVRKSGGGFVNTDRVGKKPVSQNTGEDLDTIDITGEVVGLKGQQVLKELRALQATRKPQTFVTGSGDFLGLFKIVSITEDQGKLIHTGASYVTKFAVALEFHSD